MGTTADQIFDIFTGYIQKDSELNTIYTTSGSSAVTIFTEPWLMSAIDAAERVSIEDLTYNESSGSSVGYFNATLSRRMKDILGKTMVKFWLQRQVNNALAFGRYFKDREFSYSAPMLPSLRGYLIEVTETVDQMLGEYAWDKNPWSDWQNQNFSSTT
jgi:hypothetical protein